MKLFVVALLAVVIVTIKAVAEEMACSTCNATRITDMRIAEINDRLHSLFGHGPECTATVDVETVKPALDVLKKREIREITRRHVDTESFSIVGRATADSDYYTFTIPSHMQNRESDGGIMAFFLRKGLVDESHKNKVRPSVKVVIYEKLANGEKKAVHTHHVRFPHKEFEQVFIPIGAENAQRWLKAEDGKVSLSISAVHKDVDLAVSANDDDAERKNGVMHLEVLKDSTKKHRRAVINHEHHLVNQKICDPYIRNCCKIDLVIDFHKLGWKHIIAPVRFAADACAGDCNQHDSQAHFGSIRNQAIDYSYTCCHVSKTEALQVVYVINGAVFTEYIDGMIVRGCKCA